MVVHASGNRKKVFIYSLLAGLSEPFGAVLGYLLFFRFLDLEVLSLVLGAVGGIMVFVCFDELLPISIKYGSEHQAFSGLVSGMVVVALSLYLLD